MSKKLIIIKRILPKSEFSRNVIKLLSGTAMAQAIPIAISPILTRIYSPEDFGLLAFYLALTSIIGVIATGRYELAIVMPKKDEKEEVRAIVSVVIANILMIASIIAGITYAFGIQVATILGHPEISQELYFLPLSIVFTGLYQTLNYLLIRKKDFRQLSINKICQSGVLGSSQLGSGLLGFGVMGMVASTIGSYIVTCLMILKSNEVRYYFKPAELKEINKVLKKYISFPKFDIPSTLINLMANQLPLIIIGKHFGLDILGFYSLMYKTLMAPIGLLSNSILDVFKQRAAEDYNKLGNCRDIYLKVLSRLIALGIFPFLTFALYAPEIFQIIFGTQWRMAGEMAQILSPAFFMSFLVNPLSYIFYIAQKQKLNFIFNVMFFCGMFAAVAFGLYEEDVVKMVINISIVHCINYAVYLYTSFRLSGGVR